MFRTLLSAAIGFIVGVAATTGLLWTTSLVLRWQTAPKVYAIDHGVIYQTIVIGAGFGAVVGALSGLAAALARKRHEPPSESGQKK
jgi:hypothetical protein